MKNLKPLFIILAVIFAVVLFAFKNNQEIKDPRFILHTVNLKTQQLKLYWQNKDTTNFGNHYRLKKALEANNQNLIFAMNGGMYLRDGSPQGLYIENGITKAPLDTIKKGYGIFIYSLMVFSI